jgi:hypothetical protein
MADTAYQTIYKQEWVATFEQKSSMFRFCCTDEAVIKGNTAVFLVAGTGAATAVTRGVNGLIPARAVDLTQNSCTLLEWHDLTKRTQFNIFASQGDGRRMMVEEGVWVLNRKIDQIIIDELSTGTNDTGASQTMTLALAAKARAILSLNDVDIEQLDSLFFAVSPAAMNYLIQIKEFASADYVDVKPFNGPSRRMVRWAGFNWFESNKLSGRTTSTEKCLAFHRNSIGWAMDTAGVDIDVDYDREQSYTWARASGFMGAKLLQNSGVVVVNHDGSAIVAS